MRVGRERTDCLPGVDFLTLGRGSWGHDFRALSGPPGSRWDETGSPDSFGSVVVVGADRATPGRSENRAWCWRIPYLVRMKLLAVYSPRAERVAFTLGAILAVLVVVHVLAMQANFNPALGLKERFGFHYWQLSFFDLDEEESFGTWFNSGILMMAAALLVNQARVVQAQGRAWHRLWLVLGIGFLVLSVDEIAGMHELVVSSN